MPWLQGAGEREPGIKAGGGGEVADNTALWVGIYTLKGGSNDIYTNLIRSEKC